MKFCCTLISLLHDGFHRYEWKHRGSAHIHGFLWLEGAPNMEQLDWKDTIRVDVARQYFDNYVTTWNPHDSHHRNISIHRPLEEDPFLLDISEIFNTNTLDDYEQLANRVQRHTRCNVHSCLRKKVPPTFVNTMHHGNFNTNRNYLSMKEDKKNMNLLAKMIG